MSRKQILSLVAILVLTALVVGGCAAGATTAATTAATTKAATTAATTAAATTTAATTAAATTAATTAAADQSLKKVLDKKVFVLGLDDSFPPMGYRDKNNQIVGFDIDLAKEVTKRMGVTLKLQPIDWSQKFNELNAGLIDCIWNGYTLNDERRQVTNVTDPYMKNRQVVVVLASASYQKLTDLAGKKLGVQAESSAVQALDGNKAFKTSLKQVVEFKDNVTALLDLEAKATDAVLMDEIVASHYITSEKKAFRILDEALAAEEFGIGFRKADQALRDEVQKQLKAMAADGTLAKISTVWFGRDITTIK